ncbi:MAG: tRNA (adenosine(37)-N6)-dimethylallyltransferase MiaA [bacterium]|nr:tRNA (adenosine(37)-N6)-dimethylallyltransferase MiaA [bacterium]
MIKNPVIVILGPTASGKSSLAVEMALKFNGEIISADSRQVYKGMEIGTGKITTAEMKGVKHHLLDIANPVSERLTVAKWKTESEEAIEEILSHDHLPIICGGTGFYISNLVNDFSLPDLNINIDEQIKLEKELEQKSEEELFTELIGIDERRANEIDRKNKRRLIKAVILGRIHGKIPEVKKVANDKYKYLQIGLTLPDEILKERIYKRLITRFKEGMVAEVRGLHDRGLSFERMEEFGLEYKYIAKFLKGEIKTEKELVEILNNKIWQYVRRQRTWWRNPKDEMNKDIKWFRHDIAENVLKIEGEIARFLSDF